ncbi:SPEG neighbor protein-like isoform X2 [Tachypleus tridentatus]|uniref:SPEG neighbor protein-like isoform X2 n=1 Tax=Tachypleus tridentatus TaxID=6853 RepID=UPI003FCFDE86
MNLRNHKWCAFTRIVFIFVLVSCRGSELQPFTKTRHFQLVRSVTRNIYYGDIKPYFDASTANNITTLSGKTAYLPCRVRQLADETVSWIRRKDLHVLTVGLYTYSSDQRFRVIHRENSDDWTLQVKYPQKEDTGQYECQVSTVPKMCKFIYFTVLVSKSIIKEGFSQYVRSGSTITLNCVIPESPAPPDYVFWYHNGHVINYDTREGIEVKTEKTSQTTSTLHISIAGPSDSGNYSCVPSNADPAEIMVHVINGENPAAMQDGKHTASAMKLIPSGVLIPVLLYNSVILVKR